MKFLFVRHGLSIANAEGRIQGQFDSPLSDQGREQSLSLAQRLVREGWSISVIYASDLSRASETAEILASGLDAQVVLDERLREYGFGVLTGVVWRYVEHLHPEIWRAYYERHEWGPIAGEEGSEAFYTRLAAGWADICTGPADGDTVAVVAHGGSLGMIMVHLLGMTPRLPHPFRFGNASLSIVEIGGGGLFLSLLNDTCHLEGYQY
ncbi:histidine phosphatase family protein [Chloroflexota bacterium]